MQDRAFDSAALAQFAAAYPETPKVFRHGIASHPLLTLDALASLATRLRPDTLTHNAAVDLPLGIANSELPTNGLDIHQTIARIEDCGSWALLLNIEQDPAYAKLLHEVLAEVAPIIEPKTGKMMRLEGFVFISSPGAITPLHFDPEYNILLAVRGSKTMTMFPTADPAIIPQPFFEQYFNGGPRNLAWREEWATRGQPIDFAPGDAIYVPVLAPHWVQAHGDYCISLSMTWRSEWTFHHADACRFNSRLRRLGLTPAASRGYPESNRIKSYSYRALTKLERHCALNKEAGA
jgi:hypothetical protein